MNHRDTESNSNDALRETLKQVMMRYSGKGFNGYGYFTSSDDQQIFTVISIAQIHGKRFANAGLIVRLQGDRIIIERDVNDKILLDALMQAGVPREQIVLAYAGEKVEEAV